MKKAVLVLSDGTVVWGRGIGAEGEALGEVVFCTGMTGYEEALTDPSYNGQILMFTYPLIGNYGTHVSEFESDRIHVEGVIVREACATPSHWKKCKTLHEFLLEYDIPGIEGVDTRALTIKIRKYGVLPGLLKVYTGEDPDVEELIEKARNQPSTSDVDLVAEVTRDKAEIIDVGGKRTVVIVDCGVKMNIVRSFLRRNVNVVLVPAFATAKEVLDYDPDGVVLSNGPGDPAILHYVIETTRSLIGKVPIQGICLGHQILALASGAKTYKMKFGHRGINQPVKDLDTGRVYITSQNHGFAVDPKTLGGTGFRVKQVNANDGTVEALIHTELPIISTQYHPEARPGPLDSQYLFDKFLEWLSTY